LIHDQHLHEMIYDSGGFESSRGYTEEWEDRSILLQQLNRS
jgi:hypothetical protein